MHDSIPIKGRGGAAQRRGSAPPLGRLSPPLEIVATELSSLSQNFQQGEYYPRSRGSIMAMTNHNDQCSLSQYGEHNHVA